MSATTQQRPDLAPGRSSDDEIHWVPDLQIKLSLGLPCIAACGADRTGRPQQPLGSATCAMCSLLRQGRR